MCVKNFYCKASLPKPLKNLMYMRQVVILAVTVDDDIIKRCKDKYAAANLSRLYNTLSIKHWNVAAGAPLYVVASLLAARAHNIYDSSLMAHQQLAMVSEVLGLSFNSCPLTFQVGFTHLILLYLGQ